jgi:zinc protease
MSVSSALAPEPAGGAMVLVETSRALPLIAMTVATKTGAVVDPEGKEGAMRLMARLMRRTAGGMNADVIETRIDSLGGSLGADVAHSAMSFHGAVIARSLELFIDLLSDVLCRPSLAEEEHERLKRETLGELVEARDNDRSLARRWFRRKLFQGHPYARPVGGTVSSVQRVEREDIEQLYRRDVGRNDMVLAFAGDIDRETAERLTQKLLAGLPTAAVPRDDTPEPVLPAGRRLVIVDKPERTQTQILIGAAGSHPRDEDHTALHVANTIFGGTFTARMTREIRSKRGWSYGAYSSLPYDRRRQAFSMWTFPKASDAAPCIRLELEMLAEWRERGITNKELAWAKRYLVRSHAFAIDTAAKRVGLQLDEVVYELPEHYYREYIERVRAVTLEQANAAVRARISTDDLLVAVVGTEAEIGNAVRDAIDNLVSSEVVPFDTDD